MLLNDPLDNWNLSSWNPICFYCSVASFQSQGNVNSVISPSLAPKFCFDQLHYVPLFVGLTPALFATNQKKGHGGLTLSAPSKQLMHCNRGNKEVILCIILLGLVTTNHRTIYPRHARLWGSFYPLEICMLKITALILTLPLSHK